MPKTRARGSLIGAVGALLIGAAILLFVATIILNSLKDASKPTFPSSSAAQQAHQNNSYTNNSGARNEWNDTNDTVDQLKTFLTISTILLGVMGITMIGAAIIAYIGGAFGGE